MQIIGYFVYTNLGEGCLASKFGNTYTNRLFAESAVKSSESDLNDEFIGEYLVSWFDAIVLTEHTEARLSIQRREDTISNQYKLVWRQLNNDTVLYHGEAMKYQGNLVGSYWSPNVHPATPPIREN